MKNKLSFLSPFICGSLLWLNAAKATFVNARKIDKFYYEQKTVFFIPEEALDQTRSRFKQEQFSHFLPIIKEIDGKTGSYSARVIQRDYEISNPLPLTGQTTIVSLIDQLKSSQLFAPCPENSQLIEFAESSNFLVQICLKETANDSTVFWMGYAKDGRGDLTLRIDENFEFWNFDTYYAIERRPLGENSYLLIGWPNGTMEAEALLYYYYPCFGDDC